MGWTILLFRSDGYGDDAKGVQRKMYECLCCGERVSSSKRLAHGRKHVKVGDARPKPEPYYSPRGRKEFELATDDPALEPGYRMQRKYLVEELERKTASVASILAKGAA